MKINVLNLEENEHGITELKRDDEVLGRFVITKDKLKSLYVFTEEQLDRLRKSFTSNEIDALSVKLTRFFMDNPDSDGVRIAIEWKTQGKPYEKEDVIFIPNMGK